MNFSRKLSGKAQSNKRVFLLADNRLLRSKTYFWIFPELLVLIPGPVL